MLITSGSLVVSDAKPPSPWLDYDLGDREGEEWRDITVYDGLYRISRHGLVKSLAHFDNKGRRVRARILRPFFQNGVAAQVALVEERSKRVYQVLSLVGEAFLPLLPSGQTWHRRNKLRPLDNSITNVLCGTLSESTKLTVQSELMPYTSFTDRQYQRQKKDTRDQEVGVFENGVLVVQWCRTCLERRPIESFGFLNAEQHNRCREYRSCQNRRRQAREKSRRAVPVKQANVASAVSAADAPIMTASAA